MQKSFSHVVLHGFDSVAKMLKCILFLASLLCSQLGRADVIRVDRVALRDITPQFFGFNLELVEFQNSLWDSKNKRVLPNVIGYLQRFPGAVYRYPGGTVSNHFDWKGAVGPISSRFPQKLVDWQAPKIVEFGLLEYLSFVRDVNGVAWYVSNLNGSFFSELNLDELSSSSAELATFMSEQRTKKLPDIFRWELGNELDRGRYRWPASKYSTVAKEISGAIRENYEGAKLVGMTQDWSHTGASVFGVNYNNTVAKHLENDINEFAGHAYYEGKPWGPSSKTVIHQIGKNLNEVNLGSPNFVFWVTEHGRAPVGTPSDPGWQSNWPQTADLGAALFVADMMISLARTEKVGGAFIHSLHGTSGPWPMFHKASNGTFQPSSVYWSMLLLREGLLEDVLKTNLVEGNNIDDSLSNSIVLSNKRRSRYSIWAVNRSQSKLLNTYKIPLLAGKRVTLKYSYLTGSGPKDSNYIESYNIFPRRYQIVVDVGIAGDFVLDVPGNSVCVVTVE